MSNQEETLIQNAQGVGEPEGKPSIERCLTFESGGLVMFLSTEYVTEIINDYPITPIPLVPSFIKGVINVRGRIFPALDIRLCMGMPQLEYTNKTCIIMLNIDSTVLGIVVDSVQKVMDIDLNQVHPIPIKRRQKLLDGMVTVEDGRVLMSFDYKALASGQYN